ncbi:Protein trichome birefringence-like 23 [Linum grandiflorum]
MYTNATCRLIDGHQNCMLNGRPDSGYMYWRWKPRRCDLPAFDALRFLVLMRDKSWGLIGDSISRNHVESLLCMLSTVCMSFSGLMLVSSVYLFLSVFHICLT